jgi:predicted HTH domain antitoxin
MLDREVVLVDLANSSESHVCLYAAAEISELSVEDVEWALEEYGVCETERYRIIDTE